MASRRLGQPWTSQLLLVCTVLLRVRQSLCIGNVAVAPLKAIQPLFVSRMSISDLPQYTGQATPQMLAANIGLRDSLEGMLDNWYISDNPTHSPSSSSPSASPSPMPPITLVSPSPSPQPTTNPGYIVPHLSSTKKGVGTLGTAAEAEASITASAAGKHPTPAAEASLPAIPSIDGVDEAAAVQLESTESIAPAATEAAGDPMLVASDTSHHRSLLQSAAASTAKNVCNKGSPTVTSSPSPAGSPRFNVNSAGFKALDMSATEVLPPDPTIAVGPDTAIHVVNSLVAIYRVNSGSGAPLQGNATTPVKLIPLPDFFSLVASPCDGGYYSPAATYDKGVGRFLLTAVCGGDAYQVLLAVSATSSALGTWMLYSFAGEVTQGTPMECKGYPTVLHTQVTYNQDGVYLTFVQNCPPNQIESTGAMLYALPKWAIYKGATYFWAPVWSAWQIQKAAGMQGSDAYPPSAFLQLQPVMPQGPGDVQAEVAYFVSDNYYPRMQRTDITLTALINTGSLWLYEGPGSASPAPLLVAKIIPRGVACVAVSDTRLSQPNRCAQLHAGAMRPPGFWDGGAVLSNDKIYLAHRGPDVADMFGNLQPTIYWATLLPSFCVAGPCAPWFGSDWGWSDGWDWTTGTWAKNSDRGRNAYSDPGYYGQQFVYSSYRRRLQDMDDNSSSDGTSRDGVRSRVIFNNSMTRALKADETSVTARNAYGVVAAGPGASIHAAAAAAAAGLTSVVRPVATREELRATVASQLARIKMLQAAQMITGQQATTADVGGVDATAGGANETHSGLRIADAEMRLLYKQMIKYTGNETAGPRIVFRQHRNSSTSNNTVQANSLLLLGAAASFIWKGFVGWGFPTQYYYSDYYQYWSSYYMRQDLYINLMSIPVKVNPCKYYKNWASDNAVTFGAIVQNSGVLEFASQAGSNPVGLAFPQVAVRGGQMLIVYSYAGPNKTPDGSSTPAYPGVAYSTIPISYPAGSSGGSSPSFNILKTGAGCIKQPGSSALYGAYSGMDTHYPSHRIWCAAEYAASAPFNNTPTSNSGTWISVL